MTDRRGGVDGSPAGRESSADPPTIAVTGAAGYIGSRLVNELGAVHPDWPVVALDNFYLGDAREIGDVPVEFVDVRDRSRLEDALSGADVVVHLAALSGVDDCEERPDLAYEVNVQGTENVAWYCRKRGTAMTFPFSMGVLGDPETFPVTVDLPRAPPTWYARTKLLGERAVEALADGAFPAHLMMMSNVYGEHEVDGRTVTKGTVVNFFVDRALSGEPITVYSPGTQARNYLHVDDAAGALLRSTERLVDRLAAGETGAWTYEVASGEDHSVRTVAERVRDIVSEETGREPSVEVVENPRDDEALVERFPVDTTVAREDLGWAPTRSLDESIRAIVDRRLDDRAGP